MVLKQRFAEGRTHFIDIGNNFQIETPTSPEWDKTWQGHSMKFKTDVVAVISYNVNTNGEDKLMQEPIYKDFLQWIYSDDGKLFLTLTSKEYLNEIEGSKEPEKEIEARSEKNMNLISAFIDHIKNESDNRVIIPEKHILSFFNA